MENDSRFRRLPQAREEAVTLLLEGRPVTARAGETVAAALLAAGVSITRTTPVSGAPRSPFCLMGACFDCLMVIDGVPNRQACMTIVHDGMAVARQHGAAAVTEDAN
jgi:predicted molibdopterin-dependent oxidoreductase YjgC